jgi:hypothetical protein
MKTKAIINQNEYEVEDPSEFLIKTMTYPTYPTKHVDLNTWLFLGTMGSGKSTLIDSTINLFYSIYKDKLRVIETNDLVYCVKNLDCSYVNLIIFDDAITSGLDSRQSMSKKNVNVSQSYSMFRHIAIKKMGKGILFVILALQDPKRIDAFIRRNTQLTFFKTYYKNTEFDISMKDEKYLRDITRDGMVFHDFNARAYCLCIDQAEYSAQFIFPIQKEVKVQKEKILNESDEFQIILDFLKGLDLEELSNDEIKGEIILFSEEKGIELSDSEMIYCIRKSMALKKRNTPNKQQIEQIKLNDKMKQIHAYREQGRSFQYIANMFNENKGNLNNSYKLWCNENGIKPILERFTKEKIQELSKNSCVVTV